MLCGMADRQFFVFFCLVDLEHMFLSGMLLFIFFKYLDNVSLLVVSKDQVYGFILVQFSLVRLYIASGCDDNGIRIHFFCLVKHLSGFTVCNVSYRTGIDQVNVRTRLKRYDLITRFLQKLLHGFYFIGVDFTAQVVKCNLFFHSFLLFVTSADDFC